MFILNKNSHENCLTSELADVNLNTDFLLLMSSCRGQS